MRNGCAGVIVKHAAGRDVVDSLGTLAWYTLVAADLVRVNVGNGGVALEVGRLADVLPVWGVGYGGEDVWRGVNDSSRMSQGF
jgi:hypothetical protein